jgi:hypothetical protein
MTKPLYCYVLAVAGRQQNPPVVSHVKLYPLMSPSFPHHSDGPDSWPDHISSSALGISVADEPRSPRPTKTPNLKGLEDDQLAKGVAEGQRTLNLEGISIVDREHPSGSSPGYSIGQLKEQGELAELKGRALQICVLCYTFPSIFDRPLRPPATRVSCLLKGLRKEHTLDEVSQLIPIATMMCHANWKGCLMDRVIL